MKDELVRLRRENQTLRLIARDLHWMARRYVDGRRSYAVGMFNDYTRTLLSLGVELNPTADGTIWAQDDLGPGFQSMSLAEIEQDCKGRENKGKGR